MNKHDVEGETRGMNHVRGRPQALSNWVDRTQWRGVICRVQDFMGWERGRGLAEINI